jgi:hypothetical protein
LNGSNDSILIGDLSPPLSFFDGSLISFFYQSSNRGINDPVLGRRHIGRGKVPVSKKMNKPSLAALSIKGEPQE